MKEPLISLLTIAFVLSHFSCTHNAREQNTGDITQDILSADSLLFEIQSRFDVLDYLRPLNLSEERRKFFERITQGRKYNPQFKYRDTDIDYSSLISELNTIKLEESPLSKLFIDKRDEIVTQLKLLKSIGNDIKFSEFSIDLHGLPSDEAVNFAISYLSHHKPEIKKETRYSSEAAAKHIRDALVEYKIAGWKVDLSGDISARANVNNNRKVIQINKNEHFTESLLRRLKFHEIGVHVVRHEMGKKYPLKMLTLGLAGYIETEEGMAVYNEEQNGCLSSNTLRMYCGRLIAVDKSQKHDFYAIFKHLVELGFSESEAFTITFRVKRGLIDTSSSGGFTKDHVYLSGYLQLKKYVKSPKDFNKLFKYGKIGINHLAILRKVFGG